MLGNSPFTNPISLVNDSLILDLCTGDYDIYVTDAVDSIIASIERNETDVYNIGSGVKIKINEIAEKIISIIKSKSIITKFYRKTDFDSILDISKAENKLGFKPKTCLDEGLKYEIEWHKKNT